MNFRFNRMILLSFDVEHWYTGFQFRGIKGWNEDRWRDLNNINVVLSILKKFSAKATFFITGKYVEDYPDIVKTIYSLGHEIGCHGYSHEYIYKQTPEVFEKETILAKNILTDLVNDDINGYRAASWSITRNSLWALEIIRNAGFIYDSSIYPTANNKYGIYNTPDKPYQIVLSDKNRLIEIPPQTLAIANLKLPVGGGVYLRIFPMWLNKYAIRRTNNSGFPAGIMLHPHELDPSPPRLKVSFEAWLIKYFRISKVGAILNNILSEYNTVTYSDFLDSYDIDSLPENYFD